jgi:hypothetical protein
MKNVPGVRFATAREMLQLYRSPTPAAMNRARIAEHMAKKQTFLVTEQDTLSAADMMLVLLGMDPQVVDGPATRIASTLRGDTIPRAAWERAKADAVSFIRGNGRLPAVVWIGSEKLSVGDFAATLATDDGTSTSAGVNRSDLEFEKYFSSDAKGSFSWPIHPEGFSAPELLEMGRLQGWTLKPARLR